MPFPRMDGHLQQLQQHFLTASFQPAIRFSFLVQNDLDPFLPQTALNLIQDGRSLLQPS